MPIPLILGGLAVLGTGILAASALPKPRPTPAPWPDAANDPVFGAKKEPTPPKPPKLPDTPPVIPVLTAILVANALLNRYFDKSKLSEECKEVLKKHRIHQYKDRTAFTDKAANEASHHGFQNAHLEFPRGKGGLKEICPGYKEGDGVSIPLDNAKGGAHDKVGRMQEKEVDRHRKNGTSPTYKDARQATKDQLEKGVGMTEEEAECIAKFIDETMRKICPDLVDKNLRVRTW